MTEKSNIPQDRMEQWIGNAVEAIRQTPVPSMPPAVQAAAVAKMRQAARQPRIILLYERIRAMKPRNKFVAAASFLIVVGGAIAMVAVMAGRPAVAFADVKAQLQQAKSIQMTISTETQIDGQNIIVRTKVMDKEPGLSRTETEGPEGSIVIFDTKAERLLMLNPNLKEATLMNVGGLPPGSIPSPQEWLAKINKLLDGSERPLDERVIDGKAASGFLVTEDAHEMEIWVEKATGSLMMIKMTIRWPGMPVTNVTIRDIILNKELPDSLFDLTPPDGYRVKQMAINATNPSKNHPVEEPDEDDLAAGLKRMAGFNDGVFPDQLLAPKLAKKLDSEIDGDTAYAMARVRVFATGQERNGGGFQYAGKGVKLGDARTPIAWWRGKDRGLYRVLYSDLSFKDLSADQVRAAMLARALAQRESGLVRMQIVDSSGYNIDIMNLRPEVDTLFVNKATTRPSSIETYGGLAVFDGPTTRRIADLYLEVRDPSGTRATLSICSPVRIVIYDDKEGTVASVDDLSAGDTLTIKPAPGGKDAANPEFVAELHDAQGKTKNVTRDK